VQLLALQYILASSKPIAGRGSGGDGHDTNHQQDNAPVHKLSASRGCE